jgi:hypothetical protein
MNENKKVTLRAADRFGYYLLNLKTGKLSFNSAKDESQITQMRCKGWGAKIRTILSKIHYASIYPIDKKLILQIDEKKWDLTDSNIKVKISKFFFPLFNCFKVYSNGALEFKCTHWSGAWAGFIDPTYDGIDEESDDFLLYVASNYNDPESNKNKATFFENGMKSI